MVGVLVTPDGFIDGGFFSGSKAGLLESVLGERDLVVGLSVAEGKNRNSWLTILLSLKFCL